MEWSGVCICVCALTVIMGGVCYGDVVECSVV